MSPALFIESDGDPQAPPPVIARGVRIWSFPLLADPFRLQALCDRFLNIDPDRQYEFRPLAPLVYLQVLNYPYLASGRPPYSLSGYSKQNELIFSVPVVKLDRLGEATEILMFCPYLWVDNSWSIVDGRCVFGYPKLWAWFNYAAASRTYPFSLDVETLDTYAPTSQLERRELLEITGIPGISAPFPAGLLWPFGPVQLLFGAGQPFAVSTPLLNLIDEIVDSQRYGGVQLKQFRDAEQPRLAAYQALVTMESDFELTEPGGPLPPAVVNLRESASWPIAEVLGLQGVGGVHLAIAPYWVVINFSLHNVRNLSVRSV